MPPTDGTAHRRDPLTVDARKARASVMTTLAD
jgi:hypothetical protein